jgi:hypothetical protein
MKKELLFFSGTFIKCCLCGDKILYGFGHNPAPLQIKNDDERCCDNCNTTKVIPARIKMDTSTNNQNILE